MSTSRFILYLIFIPFIIFHDVFAQEDLGAKQELFVIDEIQIQGTRKVEPEAILEKIAARKEMKLDNYLLRKDISRIYEMKYFETVEAHHEVQSGKNILIFKVKEKPIISKITLQGNDELKNDDLTLYNDPNYWNNGCYTYDSVNRNDFITIEELP